MPVRINIVTPAPVLACDHPLRRRRDKLVHKVAPLLVRLQQAGVFTIGSTATALNNLGVRNSNGSPWMESVTRGTMIRAAELGYAVRVQSQREAASNKSPRRQSNEALAAVCQAFR